MGLHTSAGGRGTAVISGIVIILATLCASAGATPSARFVLDKPARCVVDTCRVTVRYEQQLTESVRLDVDFDHVGAPDVAFRADREIRCAPSGSADEIYATAGLTSCALRSASVYHTPGLTTVAVHVTGADGSDAYTSQRLRVVGAARATTTSTPKRRGLVDVDGCLDVKIGENCGPGNSRKTGGGTGTGKVSHAGWPAITGVLWQVTSSGRGSHRRTGTKRNDELLGRHGNDTIGGGPGRDVLWGDWDPANNSTRQRDVLSGGSGADWLYTSHGANVVRGGPGNDYVWAYYGHGSIDCGPGFDTVRVRLGTNGYRVRNCERTKNFCSFGSKPGNQGGCYQPGERPR
jgi:hypothetical protein